MVSFQRLFCTILFEMDTRAFRSSFDTLDANAVMGCDAVTLKSPGDELHHICILTGHNPGVEIKDCHF